MLSNQTILDYIAINSGAHREDIRRHIAPDASETTVWRALKRLVEKGELEVTGKGPATGYSIAGSTVVRTHLKTPYNRRRPANYKKEFLDHYVPNKTFYLSESDRQSLREAGTPTASPLPAGTYAQRILERLLIDPFEQSFFILVHIPYLQAFEDINKRTSRVASNISLLKADLAPMSFLTMDDKGYIDGLIGIYEMNNVSLLREVYIEAYMTSADNYKTLRAELETPEKTTLIYRDFVRKAVRCCVIDWKAFRPELIMAMATEADIPELDREEVINYIGNEFRSLHEGNVIRYRLRPGDPENINRE